ncbi:DUF6522 family protein [Defluviimonas sp. SAOS-178_SWC]|uniref:DUF6522 family protein n=1 Tax=Defluviimonas sp. SAOS-178_SWC TaxID=3121287 RepID=UPI003221CF2B
MNGIERDGDGFVVDATILSAAFGRPAPEIRASMRDGRITSRCETGSGADAGRWRLTFYHEGRALRLTVNAEGALLKRSVFDVAPVPSIMP